MKSEDKSSILYLSPCISLSELLNLSFRGSLCVCTGKAEMTAMIFPNSRKLLLSTHRILNISVARSDTEDMRICILQLKNI